jgi:hypothetical protein
VFFAVSWYFYFRCIFRNSQISLFFSESEARAKRRLAETTRKKWTPPAPHPPTHPHTSFSKSEGISNLNSLEKVRRGKKSEFSEESF